MSDPNENVEKALTNEITVKHGEDDFTFKIPSIKDRLAIAAHAVKLRRESDPEGNSLSLGYDPNMVIFTETLATFIVLLKASSAKWVYSPGPAGKPVIDIGNWPDNVPVMEVIDQFNQELEKFRPSGN